MKKAILTLLASISFFVFNLQSVDAQDFYTVLRKSKNSLNGLEAYHYKIVRLAISIDEEVKKIGLTEERIRTICELRLRQAGLEPLMSPPPPLLLRGLSIHVYVVGFAFSIITQFFQTVIFEANATPYFTTAPTWIDSRFGTHNYNPEFITQALDGPLDRFLNEYLKANSK